MNIKSLVTQLILSLLLALVGCSVTVNRQVSVASVVNTHYWQILTRTCVKGTSESTCNQTSVTVVPKSGKDLLRVTQGPWVCRTLGWETGSTDTVEDGWTFLKLSCSIAGQEPWQIQAQCGDVDNQVKVSLGDLDQMTYHEVTISCGVK